VDAGERASAVKLDRPVLLLLPGMLNTASVFDRLRPHLVAHADVHIYDSLCSGSLMDMAERALASIAAPRVAVAGFSMGGYVALEILARAPERVAGLALLNSSIAVESESSIPIREKWIQAAHRDFPRWIDRTIDFNLHPDHRNASSLRDDMQVQMLAVGAAGFEAQVRATVARRDHHHRLLALEVPCLVVASHQDEVLPLDHSEAAARVIPGAELAVITDAGHMTVLEQPEAVAAVLATWLKRIADAERPR
jgi:pimeloyl-ACP methyl ester carboxylesterase